MLALDDPRWDELEHAYGQASDIPELLKVLAEGPETVGGEYHEYEDELWGALCHQGDVYTASYAAVPHIVRIGMQAGGRPLPEYFLLPTSIEIGRLKSRGPEVPEDLAEAYFASLRDLHELAHACASVSWDEVQSRAISAALMVSKGHALLAEAVLELTPDAALSVLAQAEERDRQYIAHWNT